MKEEKNIDRLFQEKFKDFNAKPSAKVWANIEKELKEDKERTPFIIPLWYKIGGIAAALALVFWFSQPLLTTDTTNTIVDQDGLENTKVKTQVEDKDTVQVDFLIAPGMNSRTDQTTVVNDLVSTAQSTRKDCIAVASPARTDIVNSSTPNANAVTTANTFTNSSQYGYSLAVIRISE
mgnify:CR=1 FL=1